MAQSPLKPDNVASKFQLEPSAPINANDLFATILPNPGIQDFVEALPKIENQSKDAKKIETHILEIAQAAEALFDIYRRSHFSRVGGSAFRLQLNQVLEELVAVQKSSLFRKKSAELTRQFRLPVFRHLSQSQLIARALNTKWGQIDDLMLMRCLLNKDAPSTSDLGQYLDYYFIHTSLANYLRKRSTVISRKITELHYEHAKPLCVVGLNCGLSREFMSLVGLQFNQNLSIHLVDTSSGNLSFIAGKLQLKKQELVDRVGKWRFFNGAISDWKNHMTDQSPDIIVAPNTCLQPDAYLLDELNEMLDILSPNGSLILSQPSLDPVTQSFMQWICGWPVYDRSIEKVSGVIDQLKMHPQDVQFTPLDPENGSQVFTITK